MLDVCCTDNSLLMQKNGRRFIYTELVWSDCKDSFLKRNTYLFFGFVLFIRLCFKMKWASDQSPMVSSSEVVVLVVSDGPGLGAAEKLLLCPPFRSAAALGSKTGLPTKTISFLSKRLIYCCHLMKYFCNQTVFKWRCLRWSLSVFRISPSGELTFCSLLHVRRAERGRPREFGRWVFCTHRAPFFIHAWQSWFLGLMRGCVFKIQFGLHCIEMAHNDCFQLFFWAS